MLDRELWDLVARVGASLAPGMTTGDIDYALMRGLAKIGAKSTFPSAGFPALNGVSVDEEIANGIPSRRTIAAGQLVKLDTSVRRAGAFATAAWTFRIGGGDDPLVAAGQAALRAAIAQLRVGARAGDVSAAIQSTVERAGFTVVRRLVGYAIVNGEPFQSPQLPCFGSPNTGKRLQAGQRFAIHVLAHSGATETMRDEWTLVTDAGRGVLLTATVDVGEQQGVVVGAFPGFADLR